MRNSQRTLSRESRQPCIAKRFVSISTRLIKGDTVRLIFLTYNDDDDDDTAAAVVAHNNNINNIIFGGMWVALKLFSRGSCRDNLT